MKRTNQTKTTLWAIALVAVLLQWVGPRAQAEPGLLIVAHGAPSPRWNKPVLELGRKVADRATRTRRFKAVRTAMLEFTKPDVPGAIAELEAEGCDRIIVVPLFIAPSGHTHFDLPTVLGIYSSPAQKAIIAEEGGRVARPNVPITVTQLLSDGDVLCRFALDQVRKLSKNPAEEAVVLIAHGDPDHHRLVNDLMRRATTYCCGRAGIDYGDWAFVEMGQGYLKHGLGAIDRALERKRRVLVVGVYVSSSGTSIHHRAMARLKREMPDFAPLKGKDVVFSREGFVAHPDAAAWILDAATVALGDAAK